MISTIEVNASEKTETEDEGYQLQELNNQFANVVDLSKSYAAQNHKLQAELLVKWHSPYDTDEIEKPYVESLALLRKQLNDVTRDKILAELRIKRAEYEANINQHFIEFERDLLSRAHVEEKSHSKPKSPDVVQQYTRIISEIMQSRRDIILLHKERNLLLDELDNAIMLRIIAEIGVRSMEEEIGFLSAVWDIERQDIITSINMRISTAAQCVKLISSRVPKVMKMVVSDIKSSIQVISERFYRSTDELYKKITECSEENHVSPKAIDFRNKGAHQDSKAQSRDTDQVVYLEKRNCDLAARVEQLENELANIRKENASQTVSHDTDVEAQMLSINDLLMNISAALSQKASTTFELIIYKSLSKATLNSDIMFTVKNMKCGIDSLGDTSVEEDKQEIESNSNQQEMSSTPQVEESAVYNAKPKELSAPCIDWDVNKVCTWLRNHLTYEPPVEIFQTYDVGGRILLNLTDETLRQMGVTSNLVRKQLLTLIKSLQYGNGTLLNQNPYYDQFNGDFTPPIPMSELTESTYNNVLSCQITEKHHFALITRIKNWLGTLSVGYEIDRIEMVFNPARYRMFLGHLQLVETRLNQLAFQPLLSMEDSQQERRKVLEQLNKLCSEVTHNRQVKMCRVWHGCSRQTLQYLLSDGFATLGALDEGWYGKAMYFTSSAKYATRYSGRHGCLLLCYVLILNPFPVVASDAPHYVAPSEFRFYGRGNYKNYQCHYIPVSPLGHELMLDYRPPRTGGCDDALYDELAVFQEAAILPQFVVHLK
ncbi:unnamed protein product [Didymodactylos carnosus]|uniref:SAM domain-containing protein n=1 Tax=Didymodactylos carnosus TaxID=1234261 RepID=A0A814WVG8_9BILA|nr:unnamed protein product [Didymodactylos carnosus]CAF1206058.1 unnamed protein product [Didymodactylos carnosus]CAF3757377.1 unnamed protein product [Didymodactylos carnosus]CAF3970353.1 unnamed protein product [Didymodactylos carnosus]